MKNKNILVTIDFFNQLLELYEFELYTRINKENKKIFMLNDMQGGNLGRIEQEEFETLESIMERLEIYHEDYIYKSLNERNLAKEIIKKDDWDLTAKRYIESNIISQILSTISASKYEKLEDYLFNFDTKEIINILDEEEQFCKTICQKYIKTMEKEMLLEKDDQILHIFIEDEYIDLKHDAKINNRNYQNYLDNNFETYKYNSYQELYNFVIEDEIEHDIEDLGLFDENSKWNFYINFEELKKMGYGFMVKEEFPLIEKYAVSKYKINDFFNYFTLEELKDFEKTLHLYFETDDINNDKDTLELYSKNNNTFNSNIIHLAEGLISYEDFVNEHRPLSYFDLSFEKVIQYFQGNKIKDLMEYGADDDNGLFNLSDMYKEILNKLDIQYFNIYTKNISDGKYETIIIFTNNAQITIDINAWDGIKKVTENVEKIYKNYENFKKEINQKGTKNENEFDYEYK